MVVRSLNFDMILYIRHHLIPAIFRHYDLVQESGKPEENTANQKKNLLEKVSIQIIKWVLFLPESPAHMAVCVAFRCIYCTAISPCLLNPDHVPQGE